MCPWMKVLWPYVPDRCVPTQDRKKAVSSHDRYSQKLGLPSSTRDRIYRSTAVSLALTPPSKGWIVRGRIAKGHRPKTFIPKSLTNRSGGTNKNCTVKTLTAECQSHVSEIVEKAVGCLGATQYKYREVLNLEFAGSTQHSPPSGQKVAGPERATC